MLWTELNDDMTTWTIPPERMKRAREHEVPLPDDAMALIKRLEPGKINKFVFPGRSNIRPIGHWAVWELVQRLTGREADQPIVASPHGFRASFRSWCRAKEIASDVAERCLAHERKDATQAAYDREEMLDARRPVMDAWGIFLRGEQTADIIPLAAQRA
jgi:integrase